MLENVLKSISSMLGKAIGEGTPKKIAKEPGSGLAGRVGEATTEKLETLPVSEADHKVAMTYVHCAKDLLDETIKSFKAEELPPDAPLKPGEELSTAGKSAKKELII